MRKTEEYTHFRVVSITGKVLSKCTVQGCKMMVSKHINPCWRCLSLKEVLLKMMLLTNIHQVEPPVERSLDCA